MRAREIGREAAASARSSVVSTVLIALVAFAMCAATFLTVGRSAATDARLRVDLDSAGARVLTVADVGTSGFITSDKVAMVAALSAAASAVGMSTAFDVRNAAIGAGGEPAAAWKVAGEIRAVGRLDAGRWPRLGEAVVSSRGQEVLGLAAPGGAVATLTGEEFPIVGFYTPTDGFSDRDGVLVAVGAGTTRELVTVVESIADVDAMQTLELGILAPPSTKDVKITSPSGLAAVQARTQATVGASNTAMVLIVIALGALLLAAVAFADVLIRRSDMGRRRALGASRTLLATLVILRLVQPGLVGACAAGALWLVLAVTGSRFAIPLDFVAATMTLTILAAALAGIAPSVFAANRDPVRVLRTA